MANSELTAWRAPHPGGHSQPTLMALPPGSPLEYLPFRNRTSNLLTHSPVTGREIKPLCGKTKARKMEQECLVPIAHGSSQSPEPRSELPPPNFYPFFLFFSSTSHPPKIAGISSCSSTACLS